MSYQTEDRADHWLVIENDLGHTVEIKRGALEERIIHHDAQIHWEEVRAAVLADPSGTASNEFLMLFQNGYKSPEKMSEQELIANWNECGDGFYLKVQKGQIPADKLVDDPEHDRLVSGLTGGLDPFFR